MEKQVFAAPDADEPEALVRQFLNRAFSHLYASRDVCQDGRCPATFGDCPPSVEEKYTRHRANPQTGLEAERPSPSGVEYGEYGPITSLLAAAHLLN